MRKKQAQAIVDDIVADLSDRAGIGSEWDQIPEDVQEGIKITWASIIIDNVGLDEEF